MGLIMGTWFSHPKFLDASGRPRPLTAGKGREFDRSSSPRFLVHKFKEQLPSSS